MKGIRALPLGLDWEPKLGATYECRKEVIKDDYFSGVARFTDYSDYPFEGRIKKVKIGSPEPYDTIEELFLTTATTFDPDGIDVSGVPGEGYVGIGMFDTETHLKQPPDAPEPDPPPERPSVSFCDEDYDLSLISTHEWDWTEEEIDKLKSENDVKLTGIFWKDKHSLTKISEKKLELLGRLQNSSVVLTKKFHLMLHYLKEEVVAGRIDMKGISYDEFKSWAEESKELDCLNELEIASVYYTGRLGVVCLLHPSSLGYAVGEIATVITHYLRRTPRRTVQWIDFNDVLKDGVVEDSPYVNGFFEHFGLKSASGFLSMEPQALNVLPVFKSFNPHDYTSGIEEDEDSGETIFWGDSHDHTVVDWSEYVNPEYGNGSTNLLKGMSAVEIATHEYGRSIDMFPLLSNEPPLSETEEWLNIGGWAINKEDRTYLTKGRLSTESSGMPKTDFDYEAPVSQHGCTSSSEDFAEAYCVYVINPEFMKDKFPQRFAFMTKYVKPITEAREFAKDNDDLKSMKNFLSENSSEKEVDNMMNSEKTIVSTMKNDSETTPSEGTAFDVEYIAADGKVDVTPHFIMYETRGGFPYVQHQIGTYSEYEFANKTGIKAASGHTGKITASPVLIGHHHENERGFLRNIFVATKHAKSHRKMLVKDKTIDEVETDYIYLDTLNNSIDPFSQSNRTIRGILMKTKSRTSDGQAIVFQFLGRATEADSFRKIDEDVIFFPATSEEYTADTTLFSDRGGESRYYGLLAESPQTQTVTIGQEESDQGIFKYQQLLGTFEIELYDITNMEEMERYRVEDKPFIRHTPKKVITSPHYGIDGEFRKWILVSSPEEVYMFRKDFNYAAQNFTTNEVQHHLLEYEMIDRSEITVRFVGYKGNSPTEIKLKADEEYLLYGLTRELEEEEKILAHDGITYVHYGADVQTVEPEAGVTSHLITFTYKALLCDFKIKCVDEDDPTTVLRTIEISDVPSTTIDEGSLLTTPHFKTNRGYYELANSPEIVTLSCNIDSGGSEYIVPYKLIKRDHEIELIDIDTGEPLDFSEADADNIVSLPDLKHEEYTHFLKKAYSQKITVHENLAYEVNPFGQETSFAMFADARKPWVNPITYGKRVANPSAILRVVARTCTYHDGAVFVLVDENNVILMYFRIARNPRAADGDYAPDIIDVISTQEQEGYGIKIRVEYEEENTSRPGDAAHLNNILQIHIEVDLNQPQRPQQTFRIYGYNLLDNSHSNCKIVNLQYGSVKDPVEESYDNFNFANLSAWNGPPDPNKNRKMYVTGGDLYVGETLNLPPADAHGHEIKPVATLDSSKDRTSEAIELFKHNYRPDRITK